MKKVSAELAKVLAQTTLGSKYIVQKAEVNDAGDALNFSARSKDGCVEIKGKIKEPAQGELPIDDDSDDDGGDDARGKKVN